MMSFAITKVLLLTTAAFLFAFFLAPIVTKYLYKYKAWKKKPRTESSDGSATPIVARLHGKAETSTPRMGGILIWGTVFLFAMLILGISSITANPFWDNLNFVSRSQTWIPLFALVAASLLGLVDDILVVKGIGPINKGAGLTFRMRLLVVLLIGIVGAYWFFFKLGFNALHVPFVGDFTIGLWYVPLFILVTLVVFSGGVIDGVDGLAGGTFAAIFAFLAGAAFYNGQYDLATFCGVIIGALMAFLWFNIPPARFYMSETGSLGLTVTIAVVAFFTNTVLLLPIYAFLLFVEIASVGIQLTSKRFRGKKVFLAAPIHHHFEAIGWPKYKVTMRFWLVAIVSAGVGYILFLLDKTL